MTPGMRSSSIVDAPREEKLQVKPLSEHVGAEISGVDLAAELPDDTFEKIDEAYTRYSVLVFRDQANSAHWLRISGTAMTSQKVARVRGPIANSRSEGTPN